MNDLTTDDSIELESEPSSEQPLYISPTLSVLPEESRPHPSPACETCPFSMWFTQAKQLKAYCSRMHLMVWDDKLDAVMACDGRELGLMQIQRQQESNE